MRRRSRNNGNAPSLRAALPQGDKPYLHPRFEVQFYQGMSTGDFVCATCGREFSRQEVRTLRGARKVVEKKQAAQV
jgi:hypothetical protein